MKKFLSGSKTQYIIDGKGKRTALKLYEALLEELEDLCDITEVERIIESEDKYYTLEEVEKYFESK